MFGRPFSARIATLVFVLSTGAILLPSLDVSAQGTTQGEPLGRIYVSAEPTYWLGWISARPYEPFALYVVAELDYADLGRPELNARVGIQAWEGALELEGLGEDFIITAVHVRNEVLRLGNQSNLIVGLSPAVLASATPIDLVEYIMIAPSHTPPNDVIVSVGPADPTSFGPPGPGFYESADLGDCEVIETGNSRQCLRPFAESLGGCINPNSCFTPVAAETWTRLKARY